MKQEVFFGEHIIYGLANTLVQHLRQADPSGQFVKDALESDYITHVSKLMGEIWKLIEAKLPGTMRYYDFKIPKGIAADE